MDFDFLFFAEVKSVIGGLAAFGSVHTGRSNPMDRRPLGSTVERTLIGIATIPLQEQLGSFPTTFFTNGTCISSHGISYSPNLLKAQIKKYLND